MLKLITICWFKREIKLGESFEEDKIRLMDGIKKPFIFITQILEMLKSPIGHHPEKAYLLIRDIKMVFGKAWNL